MNNNQNQQCEEESCIQCSLVNEFKELIDDDVHWENALRYVISVALDMSESVTDEEFHDVFSTGFEEGLELGISNAISILTDYAKKTEKQIEEYRAERELKVENDDESEVEEIEDISDEEFDKIAKLIRENKESR